MRQLLHAQEYWRVKDLRADVVILNEHPADYLDEVQELPHDAACRSRDGRAGRTSPAGCSCCAPTACRTPTAICCRAVARVVLRGDLGELSPQLDRPAPWLLPAQIVRLDAELRAAEPARVPAMPAPPLVMENGLGGFTPDGREYVDRARRRPRDAAALVERAGERGVRHDRQQRRESAFTWAGNSRENRLTPFANDPVTDPTGEAIFLRDEDDGRGLGRHARRRCRARPTAAAGWCGTPRA